LLSEGITYFNYKSSKKSGFLNRFFSRQLALARLISALKEFSPDVIYLRHGLYIYPSHKVFNIAPVILEVNSDDVQEFSLRSPWFRMYHLVTRQIFFKRSSGFIFVTYELKELPYNQVGGKPVCVISNGIDLKTNLALPAPKHDSPVLTIVGSPGMPWQGEDKLIPLAQTYPDLKINVVGFRSEDIKESIPSNIHFFGFLPRDKVREVLTDTDVVCGTLALHRKKMDEASPLKVREAAALGIPLILAYRDTDLSGVKTDRILQIPNTEDNISKTLEQIYVFSYNMLGKRLEQEIIYPKIDKKIKEENRLNFFEYILKI
jgi:glycosyltransferase involved in cell wall biosynthesis